jgi:hypothetical protein
MFPFLIEEVKRVKARQRRDELKVSDEYLSGT